VDKIEDYYSMLAEKQVELAQAKADAIVSVTASHLAEVFEEYTSDEQESRSIEDFAKDFLKRLEDEGLVVTIK
jgi:cell pole-organizing protein PopZ